MSTESSNLIVSYSADSHPAPFSDDAIEIRRVQWRKVEDGNTILKSWLLLGNGQVVEMMGYKGTLEIKPEALDNLPRIFDQIIEAVGETYSIGVAHNIECAEKARTIAEGRGGDRQILWSDDYTKELKEMMDSKEGKGSDDFNIFGQRLGKASEDTWTAEEHEELYQLTGQTLEELLSKGAMQRIAPFNPQDPKQRLPEDWESDMANWQAGVEPNDPEFSHRDSAVSEGNALTRALHKLHAATATRKNPETGEPEFLLHRGVSPEEYKHVTSFGPDIYNHDPGTSSWTPKYSLARGFAGQYGAGLTEENSKKHLLSAWIPESAISIIPKQYGKLNPAATSDEEYEEYPPGQNDWADEHEVVVSPMHNSKRATPEEVKQATRPLETLHGRINMAGKSHFTTPAQKEGLQTTENPERLGRVIAGETKQRLKHRFGKSEDLAPEEQNALEGEEPKSHEDRFHSHAKNNKATQEAQQTPKVVHLKQAIVQILQQVKPQLQQLEALKQSDPDTHSAILAVLQSMVEMGKTLTGNEVSEPQEQEQGPQVQPQQPQQQPEEAAKGEPKVSSHANMPVGTVLDGKVKITDHKTGNTSWRSGRSGLVSDEFGDPTSARNA